MSYHVRTSFDCGVPLQAIALSPKQEFLALACHSHIQVLELSSESIRCHMEIELARQSKDIFTLTDVDWSLYDNKIAVSATNGSIAITALSNRTSTIVWESEPTSRAVNKISWHPAEKSIFGSAHQDGSVKIWDYRQPPSVCGIILDSKADACRDIHFNSFNSNYLASVFENGNLTIWDRRNFAHPYINIAAHSSSVMSVVWNPDKEWLVATGGRDKSVKVWDFASYQQEMKESSLRPEYVLHTSSTVTKVAWRQKTSASSNFSDEIAITSSSERGDISIWRLDMNNIPACILRGHLDGCIGFYWLDTPYGNRASGNSNAIPTHKPMYSQGGSKSNRNDTIEEKMNESDYSTGLGEDYMNVFQHIISASKDGKILVQDVRSGFYPSQHMSSKVTAISALGHVAFHRSKVERGDILGLTVNAETAAAPGWFADNRMYFGLPLGNETTRFRELTKKSISFRESFVSLNTNANANNSTEYESGLVMFGMADINLLANSEDRVIGQGAEGGAADPIVIRELAARYTSQVYQERELSADPNLSVQDNSIIHRKIAADRLHGSIEACKLNSIVASSVGLEGHCTMWLTIATIVPAVSDALSSHNNSETANETKSVSTLLHFTILTANELLTDLLDFGDCQHFVACCEVFRGALRNGAMLTSVCKGISEMRIREGYVAYLEMLTRLQLFNAASEIIKKSSDQYLMQLSRQGVIIRSACGKCGKEIGEVTTASGLGWCVKCKRCSSLCIFCHQPVLGVIQWCPVCGHGGHVECMKMWFKNSVTCASGCGHQCIMNMNTISMSISPKKYEVSHEEHK